MKAIINIKWIAFIAIVSLFFSACSKKEFIDPLPESNIDLSLFGACFDRYLYNEPVALDSTEGIYDTIAFPLSGDANSFEAFKMESALKTKNGIRSVEVELKQLPYFEEFDISRYRRGSILRFEFNISSLSDFSSGTPFSKKELLDYLKVGKRFMSTVDSLGTIEISYLAFDEGETGHVSKDYLMGEDSSNINVNHVDIEKVENFVDTDFEGNVISNGLKIDLKFKFLGTVKFPDLPHDYLSCELNNGKASLYIPYE